MKYGVLGFHYNSPTFRGFAETLARTGAYSVNLGDNAQTIAARQAYRKLGIQDDDIVAIDRDSLPHYNGESATLLMNGVFLSDSFPIPPQITPIFLGFTVHQESTLKENIVYLKSFEPIGCRDDVTTEQINALGVRAFTSGCVTLTLDSAWRPPGHTKLLIVYGEGAGEFPSEVLKYVPHSLLDTAEFIAHRYPMSEYPMSCEKSQSIERYEKSIMNKYCYASLVLTPLHHVATPCLAIGVPVILCRRQMDSRFSFINKILPVHLPHTFSEIEWRPSSLDISPFRDGFMAWLSEKLAVGCR